jgi:hypothetical protein
MVPQLNTIAGGNYDILAYSENTFPLQLTFKLKNGTPIDKTGFLYNMTVRKSLKAGLPADWTASSPSDGITIAVNVVTVTKKLTVPGGKYYYEIEETQPDGTVYTRLYGFIFVNPSVTLP